MYYIMTPFTAGFRIPPLFRKSRDRGIRRGDCIMLKTGNRSAAQQNISKSLGKGGLFK